jgi:hypothetical protein
MTGGHGNRPSAEKLLLGLRPIAPDASRPRAADWQTAIPAISRSDLPDDGNVGHSQNMPSLDTDFVGRVDRMQLRPTAANSLMPLFEAVSNGLHAVEDRLGDRAATEGEVKVEVLREDDGQDESSVIGFRISDNGIGLDDPNYRSFLRPDSRHKQGRGGKGVGRLGWLKVFGTIRVDSSYQNGDALSSRSFDFRLTETEQVVPFVGRQGPPDHPGTVVTLRDFKPTFAGRCPVGAETLLRRLAAHFLPVVASEASVPIIVVDGAHRIALASFYTGQVKQAATDEVKLTLDGHEQTFLIRHFRVAKAMRPDSGLHRLFLCGDSRTVDEHGLDASLGLRFLADEGIYVGCVSGLHLDRHVNSERTGFSLPEDELAVIRRGMLASVNSFLAEEVREQTEARRRTAKGLVIEYPQFLYLQERMDEFVGSLKPGATSQEDVFVEMARSRFRRQREVRGLERKIATKGQEGVRELMDEYGKMVTADQKGVLAEYVIRRKAVLDLLDRMRGFEDVEEERQHREEALHSLVCPMQRDSTQVAYEEHNLWLVDDRLAFFAYFNSDKRLSSYTDAGSRKRPDIAFFYDTVSAWMGEGEASNTVVLVEFKRPNRDDYTGADNPFRQIGDYVDLLRNSSSLTDHRGRHRSVRLKDAAYHCYIVADPTESFQREMRDYALRPTPDGAGWFGYLGGMGREYFVEVVPYEKLLRDAKLRNAIFFQKVGLTDLDPALAAAVLEGTGEDNGPSDGVGQGASVTEDA